MQGASGVRGLVTLYPPVARTCPCPEGRNVADTQCQPIATALDDLAAIQRLLLPSGLVPHLCRQPQPKMGPTLNGPEKLPNPLWLMVPGSNAVPITNDVLMERFVPWETSFGAFCDPCRAFFFTDCRSVQGCINHDPHLLPQGG